MKIFLVFSLGLLFSFITIPADADVVIIEVESNPEGEDEGAEWARLFNSGAKKISILGWDLDSNQHSHELSGTIDACGEKMVFFEGEFLDNEFDSLSLWNQKGHLVSSTDLISDVNNNKATWKTQPPSCEGVEEQVPQEETLIEEPVTVVEINEPVNSDEKDDGLNLGISFEQNENFDSDLMSVLPYLGLLAIGVIGVLAAIIVKNRQKGIDDFEIQEKKDKSVMEQIPLLEKFQEMQVEAPKDFKVKFDKIILDKIQKIKVLQENNFGDQQKLESIKKNLDQLGSYTKKDSDYLESQYEEYTKQKGKNYDE